MIEFFQNQMDYIFFFYGLAFFVFAVSCFFLYKDKNSKLPWIFMLLFAAIHGANEWLDLASISFGDTIPLSIIRVVFLGISFLFLFEFGRRSFNLLSKTKISWLIYLILIPLSLLGLLEGLTGLNATLRYFLGFAGSALSAISVFNFVRSDKEAKTQQLLFFGIILAGYALLSGLITPKVEFFPGNIVNQESFRQISQIPVQLIRGITAFLLAFFSWNYYISINKNKIQLSRHVIQRWVISIICLLIGWVLINQLGDTAKTDLFQIKESQAETMKTRLIQELKMYDNTAKTLTHSPFLAIALVSKKKSDINNLNLALDRYKSGMNASVCYLLDKTGMTIASSNRNDKDSFVGKSYKFRPYFQNAIKGNPDFFFGLGITSNKLGYYSSYPVKNEDGKILGVAVVKKDLDEFEGFFKQFHYSFLTDPNGIIFLSSSPQYLFHSIYRIDDAAKQKLQSSGQFGNIPIKTPLITEINGNRDFKFEGTNCRLIKKSLDKDGWHIIIFLTTTQVGTYRFMGILIVLLISSILIASFLTISQIELADLVSLGKLKEDLTHMMVHDIKNPLSTMISATELLEDPNIGSLNAKQREIFDMLKTGEKKLLNLSMDILDLKKLEEDKYVLQKSNFNASDLIKELEGSTISARKEGQYLMINIEKDLNITADKNILIRILENLLSNAIKHTQPGGDILLNIKKDLNQILFEVIDTGEGIDKLAIPYIFDFFRIVENQKLKTKFDTGIGLAFCKLAIEAHSGKIFVESEKNEGTRFYFYLPAD